MCLILVAIDAHAKYRMVIAANRDEFYDRPTAPASFWPDVPELLAGRDLRAGGTWIGITRTGRVAALANYRDPKSARGGAPSRGSLVVDFLRSEEAPAGYLERLSRDAHRYNGFSLLVGQKEEIYWYSNRGNEIGRLSPGIHGLSNHLLDTPWPKVEIGKIALGRVLADEHSSTEAFFQLLEDRNRFKDESLPDTGVGLERERILSSIFVSSDSYGTRSSTVILLDGSGNVTFSERPFDKGVAGPSIVTHSFKLGA